MIMLPSTRKQSWQKGLGNMKKPYKHTKIVKQLISISSIFYGLYCSKSMDLPSLINLGRNIEILTHNFKRMKKWETI